MVPNAHPLGLADGSAAVFWRDQAGDLSESPDHARHDHGFLRTAHRTSRRFRKLLPADSDWRAGYGVFRSLHAVVLVAVLLSHRAACGGLSYPAPTSSRLDPLYALQPASTP